MDAYSNVWTATSSSRQALRHRWDDTSETRLTGLLAFRPLDESRRSCSNCRPSYEGNVCPVGRVSGFQTGRLLRALEWSQDTFEPTIQLLEQVIAQRHALSFGTYAVNSITSALTLGCRGHEQRVNSRSRRLPQHGGGTSTLLPEERHLVDERRKRHVPHVAARN